MRFISNPKLAGLLLLAPSLAFPLDRPPSLAACAAIVDDSRRLACFDRLAAQSTAAENKTLPQPATPSPAAKEQDEDNSSFSLARHWELGPEN